VVGIGTDLEASILATAVLAGLGVPDIWAKAVTVAHGRILERVGAHHVVHPEHDMGRRVAHLVTGRMIEFVQLDEGFALVELKPPKELVGRSLADSKVRSRHGITVVCIKPAGGSFTYATPDTVPGPDDVLVVAGETGKVEGFADLG
jgi:trk system potassium uptake protein TrkA